MTNRASGEQLSSVSLPTKALGSFDDATLKAGLLRNPGVQRVEISRVEDTVTVLFNEDLVSAEQIQAAVSAPDYLVPGVSAAWKRIKAKHGLTFRLVVSSILFIAALAVSYGKINAPSFSREALLAGMFVLSIPAFLRCICSLFKRGKVSADLMVWIIAAAAAATGNWIEATCVIFLSVLADVLRYKAFQPTRIAGENAETMLARLVTIRQGEETTEIPLAELQKGQVAVVRQGQMVPVDGLVIGGKAEIRDAALTGESTYQTRTTGHSILAGTMIESGSLDIQITRVGKDTLLASIDRLVNRALSVADKSNPFMDRFIRNYLLVVGVLAVIIFVLYGQSRFFMQSGWTKASLESALGFLLAACPLALVVAGPLTLYAGLLQAAQRGVLFKGGDVLEKLAAIKVLLLDKTGTLTYAKPRVSGVKTFAGVSRQDLLDAALFVERQSSHPIARAICEFAINEKAKVITPDKYLEFEGGGACAMKGSYYIKVGALWLMEDGREIDQQALDWMAEIKAQGLSFVLIANRVKLLGGIVLEDAIRENAKSVVEKIRALGIERFIMITGDNLQTAKRVTDAVGIDEAEAECMPDRKLVRIQQEQRQGKVVGMVGDGINDAPALAAADIGIAMGTHSSDLAVEAADVALINNEMNDIYLAIAISKSTVGFMRACAISAVLGNILFIALSLLGVITVIEGVLLQVFLLAIVALVSSALYFKRNF